MAPASLALPQASSVSSPILEAQSNPDASSSTTYAHVVRLHPPPPSPSLPPTPPTSPSTSITSFPLAYHDHHHGIVYESDLRAFDQEHALGSEGGEQSSFLFGSTGGRVEDGKEGVGKDFEKAQSKKWYPGPSLKALPVTGSESDVPAAKLTPSEVQALINFTSAYWPNGTLRQKYFHFSGDADDGGCAVPFELLPHLESYGQ